MSTVTSNFGAKLFFGEYVNTAQLRGLSVGYEQNTFRCAQLAELMFRALPDFALSYSEMQDINYGNIMSKVVRAAKAVYNTEKYGSRGEFGELLLHLIMRDFFNTIPAVSKIYYKDSANDTVKGFDAVHVVPTEDELQLWLGESKFYGAVSDAIRSIAEELQAHTQRAYVRGEFLFISNKIEDNWPYADRLRLLLDENVSLDEVFDRLVIPVLVTYDSTVVKNHRQVSEQYRNEFIEEVNRHHSTFRSKNLPANVQVILILVPLEEKETLVQVVHGKLEALQQL